MIGAATRESGNIVGNSLKTIFARITTNQSAVSALSAIGIAMEDASGNAKTAEQLINEVANEWDGLTDAQRRSTAVGVAGIHQLSRWNALMLNFKMGQDAATTAVNSYGSAMREQEKFNQSLQARINNLQTAWYGLADAMSQSFIYDALVVGTDALEGITESGANSVSTLLKLSATIGVLGGSVAMLSTSFRGYTVSIVQSTAASLASRTSNTALATSFGWVATSASAAAVAVRTLIAATGVGLIIVGLTAALTKFLDVRSQAIQQEEEFEEYTKKNTDALTVNKEKVDELLHSYRQLSDFKANGTITTDQEEKLIDVQNQLAELYPALIKNIDANGNAHLKTNSAIEKQLKTTLELVEAERELARASAEDTFKDALKELDKVKGERDGLKTTLKLKVDRGDSAKEIAKLEFDISKLDMKMADKSAEITDSIFTIADAFSEAGEEISKVIEDEIQSVINELDFSNLNAEELETFSKKFAEIRTQLNEALASGDEDAFATARKSFEDLVVSTDNGYSSISDLILNFEKMSTVSVDTAESLQFMDESMSDVGDSAEELDKKIADLMDDMNKLDSVQEQLTGVSQKAVDSSQDLLFMYEQLTMQLAGYSDQQLRDLQEKEHLTAEEKVLAQAMKQRGDVITLLSTLYPQYASLQKEAIALSAEQVASMKREEEANRLLLKAYELASQGKLTEEQKKTVNSASGTMNRINHIKAEIIALNALIKQYEDTANASLTSQQFIDKVQSGEMQAHNGSFVLPDATERLKSQVGELELELSSYDGVLDGLIKNLDTVVKSTDSSSKSTKDAAKTTKDATKESIYITDKYKQQIEELNLAIEKQNKLQSQYPNHTAKYRSALEGELKLQQQKLDLINSQTKALEAQIKSGKIAQTGSVSDPKSATTTVSKSSTVKSGGAWTGRLTSAQGNRVLNGKSEYHRGIDIASPQGTKLIANIAGKVIASGLAGQKGGGAEKYHSSYGNIVVVQDANGNNHLYAHLEKAIAKLNTTIEKGTQIGNIGSTGRSTGSHLHYEVTNNGKILDAASFAKEARNGSLSITQQVTETVKAVDNTQQSIDEAKSTLLSLQGDALAQQEKIAQLQDAIRESTLAEFDYKRNNFDSNLSHEVAKLKTLDKESVRYNKTLDLMTKYMEQKQQVNQDELAYIDDLIAKGGLSEIVVAELTARKLELKTAIHDLNAEIQSFKLDNLTKQYEDAIDDINDKIAHQEAKLQHLNTSSERYTQTLRNIAGGYEDSSRAVQKHINDLQKLIDTQQVTGDNLDATVDKINDLKVELENLHKQIMDKNYEVIVNIKTQYDDQTDDLQFEIDRSKAIMGMYEEGTANYNNELTKQIELTKQQMTLYDQSRRELQKQMNQVGLNAEQKKDLMEQMEDLSLSYVNAEASIRSMTKALEDSNKAMLESIADAYINAYKEYVREISEEHMTMLDEQAEAEQDAYEKRKKLMDDEMDEFRKNVEEKLRLIRRQEDERSYQKDLDKMEKDRNDIVKKINLLSLDNSYEAKKKREALVKELAEIDEEIAEHKHARDIELQEQALNDLLEQKEKEFEIQQEHNDKVYDDTVKLIDRQREYWQKYYRDLENDERKFAQIREDILAGHFDKVNAEFESMISQLEATMPRLVDTMDGTMQGVGTAIRQNVIDQLREAMKMVDDYKAKMDEMSSINLNNKFTDPFNPNEGKGDLPTSTSPSDTGSSNSGGDKIRNNGDVKVVVGKYIADIMAPPYGSTARGASILDKAHMIADEGRDEGSEIEVNRHFSSVISEFSEADIQKIKSYVSGNAENIFITPELQQQLRKWAASLDSGGYLNFSSSGGLDGKGGKAIIAHDGEVVLNKVQTNRLLDNIEVSDGLMSKITSMASMFSNIVSGMSPTLSTGGGYGDITVNFGDVHNATQQQAENFASQFINRINTIKGGF